MFYDDALKDASLETFLNRPVRIASYTWAEGANINVNFKPWHLFFNNAVIKKKVDNYAFVNCNLKLKIVINASPFYYGLALASYKPLESFDAGNLMGISTLGQLVPKSQRPHIWLYPQSNQGGEMTLPFLYHMNWLDLTSASTLQDMGTISIDSVDGLANANTTVGIDVDIQVYCWAENVRVSGPTYEQAVQSGKDEYSTDGMISKPASAVASIADKLSDLPVIGKYMKATSMIGNGVASIASYLGFTNVPNIKEHHPFKSLPFGALASSEISTPVDKLTFDPKNELTIDNTVCGADNSDELLIKNFTSKESYIYSNYWAGTDVTGDRLLTIEVNPNLFQQQAHATYGTYINYIPMAYAAQMFRYWRGDIVYRFRFICSKYHRGRVRLSWDPISNSGGDEEVYNYSKIIDIAENPDVEFSVQYNQARMWADTSTQTTTSYYGNGLHILPGEQFSSNGFLKVDVVNAQTSPVVDAPILIVVSARAGSNFELAGPRSLPDTHGFYDNVPQSEEIPLPVYKLKRSRSVTVTDYSLLKQCKQQYSVNTAIDNQWCGMCTVPESCNFDKCIRKRYILTQWILKKSLDPESYDGPELAISQKAFLGSVPQCGHITKLKMQDSVRDGSNYIKDAAAFYYAKIATNKFDEIEYLSRTVSTFKRKFYESKVQSDELDYETKTLKVQEKSATHDALYLAHMGESIQSLRQILRRSVYTRSSTYQNLTPTAVMNLLGSKSSRYPLYNGFDPDGIHTCTVAAVNGPYNYVKNIPFNWLGACFLGSRGAVHWHINSSFPYDIPKILIDRHQTVLDIPSYEGIESSYTAAGSRSSKARLNSTINTNAFEGISLIDQKSQAGLSVSLPFYSKYRMRGNDASSRTLGNVLSIGDGTTTDSFTVLAEMSPASGDNPSNLSTHFYTSIGTDFNFVFFLNVPTLLVATVPAAV